MATSGRDPTHSFGVFGLSLATTMWNLDDFSRQPQILNYAVGYLCNGGTASKIPMASKVGLNNASKVGTLFEVLSLVISGTPQRP